MEQKTKKSAILLIILFLSLVLVFPASAADSNDDIVNTDENILTADESITETNKIDVELITNEQYGTYGNPANISEQMSTIMPIPHCF